MDIHLATRTRPDGMGIQRYAGAWSHHGARYEALGLTFPDDDPRRPRRDGLADALAIVAATGTQADVRVFTSAIGAGALPRSLDGPAAVRWLQDHHPAHAPIGRPEALRRRLQDWTGTLTVYPPNAERDPRHVAEVHTATKRAARDPDPLDFAGYRPGIYRNVRTIPTNIPAWTGPEAVPVDPGGHRLGDELPVPQVRARFLGPRQRPVWIPVRAPGHDDADVFDAHFWHWHIDLRFAPATLLRHVHRQAASLHAAPHAVVIPTLAIAPAGLPAAPDRYRRYQRAPDGRTEDHAVGRMLSEIDPASWQRVAPMRLQRHDLDNWRAIPETAGSDFLNDAFHPALQDHCAGRTWAPDQRCPHRGASLEGVPIGPDGLLVCPVHRLVIDARNGRVPGADELRERLAADPGA